MTILRALLLSFLCLAVLPWVAFARHVTAPGAVSVVAPLMLQRADRPCRVAAALQGLPCVPEAVLAAAAVAGRAPDAVRLPFADARLQDIWWPQRPLDPPKSDG